MITVSLQCTSKIKYTQKCQPFNQILSEDIKLGALTKPGPTKLATTKTGTQWYRLRFKK